MFKHGTLRLRLGFTFLLLCAVFHPMLMQAVHGDPLNPAIEGTYQIFITCEVQSTECRSQEFAHIDRLTIVDSLSSTGVWIGLASHSEAHVIGSFMMVDVAAGGTRLSASPKASSGGAGRFSYVELSIDPRTGGIEGILMDNRTVDNYRLKGQAIRTVGDLIAGQPPSGFGGVKVVGRFRGSIAKYEGELIIKQRPDHHLVGSFASFDQVAGAPVLEFNFYNGAWDPVVGIMRLVFPFNQGFGQGELALAVREARKGSPELSGFEFAGFANNESKFTRTN